MSTKYIYLKSFVSGFLFVFGINENPTYHLKRKFTERNDADEMAKDWQKIGIDIQKSYEQYKSSREAI